MTGDSEGSRKYVVGYGKPPVEHQFKKGRSGNPSGKRKGSKNKPKPLRGIDQPTRNIILEEAYRSVSLREGDKIIELPAIQAVIRAMSVSAMKGNRLAQKLVTEIVQKVEKDYQEAQYKDLETFTEYKLQWSREIQRCEKLGLPPPDMLPHPDDVLIDYRAGTFRIAGPITKEEKTKYDMLMSRRDEAQATVNELAELLPDEPESAKFYLDDIAFEERMFNLINDQLPERYQRKFVKPKLRVKQSPKNSDNKGAQDAAL